MKLHALSPHLNPQSWRDAAANRLEEVTLMADLEQHWTQWIVDAGKIWSETRSAAGTLAAKYLAGFGIHMPLPPAIRYHPALMNWPEDTPAMISLVVQPWDGAPLGVHQTCLARDGSDLADVEFPRSYSGYSRNGVVRLAEPDDVLLIGADIASSLLAMQETGIPAWAMPSQFGWSKFVPPQGLDSRIRDIVLLVDSKDARAACPRIRGQAQDAVQDAARHWKRQGRRVYVLDACPACLPRALPARLRGRGCPCPRSAVDIVH